MLKYLIAIQSICLLYWSDIKFNYQKINMTSLDQTWITPERQLQAIVYWGLRPSRLGRQQRRRQRWHRCLGSAEVLYRARLGCVNFDSFPESKTHWIKAKLKNPVQ